MPIKIDTYRAGNTCLVRVLDQDTGIFREEECLPEDAKIVAEKLKAIVIEEAKLKESEG